MWSTVATAFKLGLQGQDVTAMLFVATAVSVLIFLGYILFTRQLGVLAGTTRRDLVRSAVAGALNPFAYYLILFKAYSLLPAQLAQPLNMIWPVTLALLSIPLLKQKIRWQQLLALMVCFAGIALLSSQGSLSGFKNTSLPGVLLATGSSLFWAGFWILNVRDSRPAAVKMFLNFSAGLIYLLVLLLLGPPAAFGKGIPLLAAVYTGIFETGITYLVWMKAMQMSDNNAVTGSLMYLTPFLSLVFIATVLGEKIHLTTIAGLLIIVAGILVMQFFSRHERKKL